MAENSLQSGGYLQFDARTMEQYIKDRLNSDPNNKFTDHNFEGSYFSTLIETISYLFNVLMFYLNQTSTEAKFTDAQLYENLNRIVKILGYNPIGYQTALVPFEAISSITDNGLYVVPRYSYLNVGGTSYSFNTDFTFRGGTVPNTSGKMLYQGRFREYPLYEAAGLSNETLFLTPGDIVIVDHFNIDVYVKSKFGRWEQWNRVESLVSKTANDKCYEVRFNENERYELKFGNGINGAALQADDMVAIYYLQSDGQNNEMAENTIADDVRYVNLASNRMSEILNDIWITNPRVVANPALISFANSVPSTLFSGAENVESIRANAPDSVKRKLTISKTTDYERVVRTTFSNLISDVKAFNNFDYIKQYLEYFRLLDLDSAFAASRVLFNQTMFADSCNFNNMYVFIKPKIYESGRNDYNKFLPSSAKQLILNEFESLKQPTVEPIIMDPVYMAVGFGINAPNEPVSISDAQNSKLTIIRSKLTTRSDEAIKQDVVDVILNFFSQENSTFGMFIDFATLTSNILAINGVSDFKVSRTDIATGHYYSGMSMILWNPVYEQDVRLLLRSETMKLFQVPYLINQDSLSDNILIEVEA